MDKPSSQEIINSCISHGFALAGVAKAARSSYDTELESWLAEGRHGEMEWLSQNVEVRLDPRNLLEHAKSVICVADRYGELDEPTLKHNHGRIARYAMGKDYHKVMKRRLHSICDSLQEQMPHESFRVCVDTAPVLERELASKAGLGSIGKHTLLIEQGIGSWMLLGVIVTTAELEVSEHDQLDPCGTCTRCIDACPTDAITPWSVDARACISYLTIEHRTEIAPEYYSSIGDWVFGCDICQEVCPHNQSSERGASAQLNEAYSTSLQSLNVLEVLQWNSDLRRDTLSGSSMKRAKLGMMRRNAAIVAGNLLANAQDEILLNELQSIAQQDEDKMVRNTAIEVLNQRKIP